MTDCSNKTDPLIDAVASFIDQRKLIAPHSRVVVGVSGGCDSLAALAILRQLAIPPERGYDLTVAHLDHALRAESPQDARFVAELAEGWNLPCVTERIDISALAAQRSLSLEAAARMARYEFLERTADRVGAQYVAVAHHADDNAETICHRILRGSHLRGACGIRASRKLGESQTLLVRPLLNCRRDDIEAFCKRANLEWRIDPTNAHNDFTRNFILNELLPLIKQRINPQADMALVRLGEAIAQAEDFIAARASNIADECISSDRPAEITIDLEALNRADRNLRGWIFRQAVELSGIAMRKVSAQQLQELSALADGVQIATNLPDNYVARRCGDTILIAPASRPAPPNEAPIILNACGRTDLPSGAVVVCGTEEFDAEAFAEHCRKPHRGVELLDADKIRGQLVCKPRTDGDRFAPLGLNGSQTVSDFLTNSGLNPSARNAVRCICDDESIIYLAPLRIDQRVRVTDQTRRLVRIEVNDPPGD